MSIDHLAKLVVENDDVVASGGVAFEVIREAERRLGGQVHPDVRAYLRRFGSLAFGHYEFYGLGAKVPQHLDLVQMTLRERTEMEPPLPENMVALLNWGNGSLACVACGLDPDARVFYADHEIEGSERISVDHVDFASWIVALFAEP